MKFKIHGSRDVGHARFSQSDDSDVAKAFTLVIFIGGSINPRSVAPARHSAM